MLTTLIQFNIIVSAQPKGMELGPDSSGPGPALSSLHGRTSAFLNPKGLTYGELDVLQDQREKIRQDQHGPGFRC
jgi:hypothetical protein